MDDFTAKDAARLAFYIVTAPQEDRKLVLRALVGERMWKAVVRFSS